MQKKILISPTSFGMCGKRPLEILKEHGYSYILNPHGRKMTQEEVIELGNNCSGIIAGVEPLDKRVLKSLTSLKCISRCGVGVDNIDMETAKELGIIIRNTPDIPTRAVAELTIGLIFDVLRNISYLDRETRNGNWKKKYGNLLEGKIVGVVGLGRIGRMVANLLIGLNAKVIGSEINPDIDWLKNNNIRLLPLDELLKTSDIVCIHVSYSPENRYLIDEKEIKIMKKGAFLINPSRGGIVKEDALFKALKNDQLAGAALDVYECEPYSGSLRELENVVLTPHIGTYARESRLKMEIQAVENLLDSLSNKDMGNLTENH
ncbi:MAG: phosphoglycerate dehydrogenase [Promethearchaeota archaeon]|jgi:D-3-phosphoglycerate dehydrogenase